MQQVSGKMLVVLNINAIEANMICSASSDIKQGDFCFVANYNSSTQIVLSGSENAIIKAQEFASKMNKKSMVLKVSGPFHSPYMKEAAQELAQTLSKITFNKPDMPVISNVYAHCDVNWEESVKLHMFMPVRWEESLKYISHTYANEPIYEIGASSILTNMAKRDGYNMMYFEKYENK
jgi:[acyl-carrier-protein] S-malonyltransferase